MKVFVVTNVEAGWDCIVGVFESEESAQDLCDECPDTYIIHETTLQ